MNFGNGNKFNYGRILAAALAYLCMRQHDMVGLTLFGEETAQALPARSGRHHLDEMFQLLARTDAQGRTQVGDGLWQVLDLYNRRGLAVIISDLFSSPERIFELFQQLHHRRQEIIVFHLMSAEELEFGYEGECIFEDVETGEEIVVHASSFREGYLARVAEFRASLEKVCGKFEIDYHLLPTSAPLESALIHYLGKRLAT